MAAKIAQAHLPDAALTGRVTAALRLPISKKRWGDVLLRMQVIGSISGSGRITLVDNKAPAGEPTPVDLDLEKARAGTLQRPWPPFNSFFMLHSCMRDAFSTEADEGHL